jgi:cytochrome d ubiquinol oxidase subunit II
MWFFFMFYFISTCATLIYMPFMAERMRSFPWLFLFPVAAFFLFGIIPGLFAKGRDGTAFLCSCFGIATLIGLFGIGTYPVLVRSSIDPAHSLTIFNAASSLLTLEVLLIIVLIGVPLVLGYGFYIYRIFRGKVKLSSTSY